MHVVATAGHVDHGKSTLLRAITGQEPDRWAEERRRGLTIDLGFVWTDLPSGATVAFVDVPGHHRFVDNALAGTGAVTDVLLVVAADDGWSAQTQEHVEIADLLGLRAVLVTVTKTTTVSSGRVDEVVDDVTRRLGSTSLAGAPVVAVDAVAGGADEVARVVSALDERLATASTPALGGGRSRLWVDRAFSVAGAGTVVTGTLAGGPVRVGDTVALAPLGRSVRVRGLHELGRAAEVATGPARVAMALADVDLDEIGRGHAVLGAGAGTDPAAAWLPTTEVDVWARSLAGRTLERTGDWVVHVGSARLHADVLPVGGPIGAPDQRHPDRVPEGPVRLVLPHAVPLLHGDRIVLRETGRRATMGGAIVLDADPERPLPRGDARDVLATRLAALHDADGGAAVVAALVADGARPERRVRAVVRGDAATDDVRVVQGVVLDRAGAATAERLVLAAAATPRPAARLVEATGTTLPTPAVAALVRGLVDDGRLTAGPDGLVATEAADAVTGERDRRIARLLGVLDEAGLAAPPRLRDAAEEAGVTRAELQQLVQRGDVVAVGELGFTRAHVDAATEAVRRLASDGPFTAAEAKRAWGTTRRAAIPLLEHLDARGITVFDGQHRTLREKR